MTLHQAFQPLYVPYAKAGRTITEFVIATYTTLTSDRAQEIYTIIWVVLQLAFWFTVLAVLYTVKAGRGFRAYYEAEWAKDVNRLSDWVLTYPDRCLKFEIEEPRTTGVALTRVATPTEAADIEAVIPQEVQLILESDCTKTIKLRKIASFYKIPWRGVREDGKHLRNKDIQAALSDYPNILAAL